MLCIVGVDVCFIQPCRVVCSVQYVNALAGGCVQYLDHTVCQVVQLSLESPFSRLFSNGYCFIGRLFHRATVGTMKKLEESDFLEHAANPAGVLAGREMMYFACLPCL